MGASQSTETDTTQIVLENDEEGGTKVSKRWLSQEELKLLSEDLENVQSNKNVTIDAKLYKSIASDLGIEISDEEEVEEEEEEEYYEEVEAYELVEPIQAPDNFTMVPGISVQDISAVGQLQLPPHPPPFVQGTQPSLIEPGLINIEEDPVKDQVVNVENETDPLAQHEAAAVQPVDDPEEIVTPAAEYVVLEEETVTPAEVAVPEETGATQDNSSEEAAQIITIDVADDVILFDYTSEKPDQPTPAGVVIDTSISNESKSLESEQTDTVFEVILTDVKSTRDIGIITEQPPPQQQHVPNQTESEIITLDVADDVILFDYISEKPAEVEVVESEQDVPVPHLATIEPGPGESKEEAHLPDHESGVALNGPKVETSELKSEPIITKCEPLISEPEETAPAPENVPEESQTIDTHSEAQAGLFSYIQKAIDPYFPSPKDDHSPDPAPTHSTPDPAPTHSTPEPVINTSPQNTIPQPEQLAESLFGEYRKQEVEKLITDAKMEGARRQAKLDADVMSSALNAERSRWRSRFGVIESNLNKRKQEISTAHSEGIELVSSKLSLPGQEESCTDNVKDIITCYQTNPDRVLRCNELSRSFDSCVSKALSSR